jgi:hypothetical protein
MWGGMDMTSKHIPFREIDTRSRGSIVNVAFTIDTYCLDLLNQAGKNKSKTVRMAIINYLGNPSDAEPTELQLRYRDKCIEVKELTEIVALQRVQIERIREVKPTLLKRIRNLFYKHRK